MKTIPDMLPTLLYGALGFCCATFGEDGAFLFAACVMSGALP